MDKKRLEKEYWESYYKKNHANKEHIISVCSYYNHYWKYLIERNKANSESIIEIGGFPGRYLAYLSARYNLIPTSLDYNSDVTQIKDSFKVMGVDSYNILQEDFTNYQPKKKYDYVFSNGFIEHFENFDEILDKHLEYLKPKGKIMIMIPNKRYLRKYYGYLCDYENLKAHNLKCMNLKVFNEFSKRNNLKIIKLEYFGGFPFSVHQNLNFFQKIIYHLFRFFFKKMNKFIEKRPSKYFSSLIVYIAERN